MLQQNFVFSSRFLSRLKPFNLTARKKSFNSSDWLKRHDSDPYIIKARRENYRCRSAYKLMEIDDQHKLVKPGDVVLDIGASPGSWSQVLAIRTNSNGNDLKKPKGVVIAIDINYFDEIEGVMLLRQMDFTKESSQQKILQLLGSSQLDFVFSDMAPPATGVKNLDQENIIKLLFPVLVFAVKNMKVGGGCLFKIWEGQHHRFVEEMKKFFKRFKYVKPNATYSSSSEIYLLGQHFVGLKR